MAYERTKKIKKGEGLDAFLEGMTNLYKIQLSLRNSAEELRFNTAVLEDNLSLEDQLDYRIGQLERVDDDPEERKRVRLEVANLKDRIEQKEFSDKYLEQLIGFESGISSIDSIIDWLENAKINATDIIIKDNINRELVTRKGQKFDMTQNVFKNQTSFALKDRTETILETQISRVNKERNKALLSDNQELLSNYDLQLQALNKAQLETSISKDMQTLAVSTITGYSNAVNLLDSYNTKISSSNAVGAIAIGEVTYNSVRDFWTYTRDSYLADSSSAGFFNRFNSEKTTELNVKKSKNLIYTEDINKITNEFNNLAGRSEFVSFMTQLDATRQNIIQTGTDILAGNILNKYKTDFDLNSATAKLNSLRSLGGNVENSYTSLLISGGETKQSQVSSIMSEAQNLIKNNPSLSISEAIDQSIKAGAGAMISYEQLATKSEEEIAKELAKGTEEEKFVPDIRTTIQEPTETAPPVVPQPKITPTPAPASVVSPPIALSRQLDFGTTGADVKELQKFLNRVGFQLASTGAGASGEETEYFGELTQKALQKFQAAQGIVTSGDPITTGYGRVGPQTLTAIKEYKY